MRDQRVQCISKFLYEQAHTECLILDFLAIHRSSGIISKSRTDSTSELELFAREPQLLLSSASELLRAEGLEVVILAGGKLKK